MENISNIGPVPAIWGNLTSQSGPPSSFTKRMKDVFFAPPAKLMEFAAELKTLTREDKEWFTEQFNTLGYPTELSAA